jgi:ribosomal protein L28
LVIGLYHGRDVRFGHSISHSHAKSLRRWNPNVVKKHLWSDALNRWVRFNITVAGMKAVDDVGGIDQYLLNLDQKLVSDSNYITKVHRLITAALYHKNELSPKHINFLGFHTTPPDVKQENIKIIQKKSKYIPSKLIRQAVKAKR